MPYYLGFVCKTLTDYSDLPKQKNEVLVPRSGTAKATHKAVLWLWKSGRLAPTFFATCIIGMIMLSY